MAVVCTLYRSEERDGSEILAEKLENRLTVRLPAKPLTYSSLVPSYHCASVSNLDLRVGRKGGTGGPMVMEGGQVDQLGIKWISRRGLLSIPWLRFSYVVPVGGSDCNPDTGSWVGNGVAGAWIPCAKDQLPTPRNT